MGEQKTISGRAWAELTLLALIWGASFLAIRIAITEVPVLTSVLLRTSLAMTALWLYVVARRLPLPRDAATWAGLVAMGALNNVIPFALMAWGQLHIETGLTSILNAASAVFGVLVAALVFADERLSARKIAGVGLGFAGVVTVIGPGLLAALDLRSLGQLAVLGGALSYAFAAAFARARLSHLRPEVAAAGMLAGSTLILLPLVLLFDGVPTLDYRPVTWAAVGYYALIATALAYLLYYRILAMAGSGNLMVVTLLIPPVSITLGALVLDEALAARAYAGFALIALGLSVLDGRAWARLRLLAGRLAR